MTYTPDPTQLNQFLAAERQQESGGNYRSNPTRSGASGAYQFEPATWDYWAGRIGAGQYVGQPAAAAPAAVQDQAAAAMATSYYGHFGNWLDTAESWYYPAAAGNPAEQNIIPPGNRLTVGQYGSAVVAKMGDPTLTSSAGSAAGDAARAALMPWTLIPGGSSAAKPIVGWLDNYAMRAALFVIGGAALLIGLLHLTQPGESVSTSTSSVKGSDGQRTDVQTDTHEIRLGRHSYKRTRTRPVGAGAAEPAAGGESVVEAI